MWKITLPSGPSGHPKEAPFTNDYADEFVENLQDEWLLIAPCKGTTTPNSKYPRCELRELSKGKLASWDLGDGFDHALIWEGCVDELPKEKPQTVFGQVHDKTDDLCEIKLDDKRWFFHTDKGDVTLFSDYKLGTKIAFDMHCIDGTITVNGTYNGKKNTASMYFGKRAGCYFKVGNYQQGIKGVCKLRLNKNLLVVHGERPKPSDPQPPFKDPGCHCCCHMV